MLFDDNGISIDGAISLVGFSRSGEALRSLRAGRPKRVDGHDQKAIADCADARTEVRSSKPSLIACKTTIGFGAPNKAGSEKSHGSPLGADEIAGARKNLKLGISLEPFSKFRRTFSNAWRAAGSAAAKPST